MSYQGKYWEINNFSGGYCPDLASTNLALNQASDMRMAVVGPNGSYIRAMLGSAKGNATELGTGADGWPVTGVGQLIVDGTTEYVVAIKKDKIYSSAFSGVQSGLSFTDRTGAFAGFGLEASASNQAFYRRTSFCMLNNLLIGFGGRFGSVDTPFKWSGSGNIAALGGTPPSATKCFSTNNRVFAYGLNSPSEQSIYWSILSNPEDWTGSGSGNATVGGSQDGERILTHAVLSNNITLLFKKNTIYQMVTDSAPFSITPLFSGVGCICPEAIVVVNGMAYFINSEFRLCSTDGNTITEYPNFSGSFFRYGQYDFGRPIFSHRLTGHDYDWIFFTLSAYKSLGQASTQSGQIAWDLKNKCWVGVNIPTVTVSAGVPQSISNTVNASCISGATFSDGTFWGGFIAGGFVIQPDYPGLENVHDTGATEFQSHWTTGWVKSGTKDTIVRPARLVQTYSTTASGGNITTEYGVDFVRDGTKTLTYSVAPTASETVTSRSNNVPIKGNFLQFRSYLNDDANSTTLHSLMLYGETSGTEKIT